MLGDGFRLGVCFEEFNPAPARSMRLLSAQHGGFADHIRCWEDPTHWNPAPGVYDFTKKFDRDVAAITDAGMDFIWQNLWLPAWMTGGVPAFEEGIHGVWVIDNERGMHIAGECKGLTRRLCDECERSPQKVGMVRNPPPIDRDAVRKGAAAVGERYRSVKRFNYASPSNEPDMTLYWLWFFHMTRARDGRDGRVGPIDDFVNEFRNRAKEWNPHAKSEEIEQRVWQEMAANVKRLMEPEQVFGKLREDIFEPFVAGLHSTAPHVQILGPEAAGLNAMHYAPAGSTRTAHPYIWDAGPWPGGSYERTKQFVAKAREMGYTGSLWLTECDDETPNEDGDLVAYVKHFQAAFANDVMGVTFYSFWQFFAGGQDKQAFFVDDPQPNAKHRALSAYVNPPPAYLPHPPREVWPFYPPHDWETDPVHVKLEPGWAVYRRLADGRFIVLTFDIYEWLRRHPKAEFYPPPAPAELVRRYTKRRPSRVV